MKTNITVLSGDSNVPDMPIGASEINHLRRLLAWMCCEYILDEHMQRGCMSGAAKMVVHGLATPEQAGEVVMSVANKINHVPAYIRHSVVMLTKKIEAHDRASKIIDLDKVA